MLSPIKVDKRSSHLGAECALCKELFAPSDEIVVCPEDDTRHHVRCWQANGNHCSALGCHGNGVLQTAVSPLPPSSPSTIPRIFRHLKLPFSTISLAQSCLILSIAFAIVLIAFSCFGLWAIADYIMIELLGWQYREPLSSEIILPVVMLLLSVFRIPVR
jgi:hypothetical protein